MRQHGAVFVALITDSKHGFSVRGPSEKAMFKGSANSRAVTAQELANTKLPAADRARADRAAWWRLARERLHLLCRKAFDNRAPLVHPTQMIERVALSRSSARRVAP
jgi:hypothetical protein